MVNLGFLGARVSASEGLNPRGLVWSSLYCYTKGSFSESVSEYQNFLSDLRAILKDPSPKQLTAMGDFLVCQARLQTKLCKGSVSPWEEQCCKPQLTVTDYLHRATSKLRCHYSGIHPATDGSAKILLQTTLSYFYLTLVRMAKINKTSDISGSEDVE